MNHAIIESWKVPIYRTQLKQAGIKYQRFQVDAKRFCFKFTDTPEIVSPILKSAYDECERLRVKYLPRGKVSAP